MTVQEGYSLRGAQTYDFSETPKENIKSLLAPLVSKSPVPAVRPSLAKKAAGASPFPNAELEGPGIR